MAVFSYLVIGNQRVRMTSEERIRQLESENAALKDKVSDLDRKIAAKDNRIAYLEKQLYGQRTEKHLPVNPDALQLSLFHNAAPGCRGGEGRGGPRKAHPHQGA